MIGKTKNWSCISEIFDEVICWGQGLSFGIKTVQQKTKQNKQKERDQGYM